MSLLGLSGTRPCFKGNARVVASNGSVVRHFDHSVRPHVIIYYLIFIMYYVLFIIIVLFLNFLHLFIIYSLGSNVRHFSSSLTSAPLVLFQPSAICLWPSL